MSADTERWLPIPGFPGYEVSDQGRVRSYRMQVKFGGGTKSWIISDSPQRILRPGVEDKKGYQSVNLTDEQGNQCHRCIHSLVMLAFVGPCPSGQEVCHNDGNGANNKLENLRYDNHKANMMEICTHSHYMFTPEDILTIRQKRADGMTCLELALEYNVSDSHISSICMRRIYALVGGPKTIRRGGTPKLSPGDAQDIYRRATRKEQSQRNIAEEYGVSEATVSRIVNGELWSSTISQLLEQEMSK